MFGKKKRRGSASPAACLLPQIEENLHRRYGTRRRDPTYRDGDSPGKLFTYVSAGNIERPEDNPEPQTARFRSSRPVVLLAVLLVLIWFAC
ncbi:MAG: hypothetical protein ACOX9C_04195 [Kiritimatiellia bacterium]